MVSDKFFLERDGLYNCRIKEKWVELRFSGRSYYNDAKFSFEPNQGSRVDWIVPVLKGSFSGYLNLGGAVKRISGIFFHDHVRLEMRLSLDLLLNFKKWSWGLIYTKQESILYVSIEHKKMPLNLVYAGSKKEIVRNEVEKIAVDNGLVSFDVKGKRYISNLDRIHRVDYSSFNSKALRYVADRIINVKKYRL